MKTFRTIKYRSLTKQSPSGRSYIFVRDKDVSAVKNGQYYLEDEAWMMELTCGDKPLLVWTNMPEEIVEATKLPSTKVMLSDTFGYQPKEDVTRHIFGRSDSQIQAELALAQLDEEIELSTRPIVEEKIDFQVEYESLMEAHFALTLLCEGLEDYVATLEDIISNLTAPDSVEEVIESLVAETEVLVTPEVEEDSEVLVSLEVEEDSAVLVSETLLKLKDALAATSNVERFVRDMKPMLVDDLKCVAEELGLEYEGKKVDMLRKFAEKLSN